MGGIRWGKVDGRIRMGVGPRGGGGESAAAQYQGTQVVVPKQRTAGRTDSGKQTTESSFFKPRSWNQDGCKYPLANSERRGAAISAQQRRCNEGEAACNAGPGRVREQSKQAATKNTKRMTVREGGNQNQANGLRPREGLPEEGEAGWLSVWSLVCSARRREGQPAGPGEQQKHCSTGGRGARGASGRRGAAKGSSVQPGLVPGTAFGRFGAPANAGGVLSLARETQSQTRNPPLNSRYRERGPGWLGVSSRAFCVSTARGNPPVGLVVTPPHTHRTRPRPPPLRERARRTLAVTKSRAIPAGPASPFVPLCLPASGLLARRRPPSSMRGNANSHGRPEEGPAESNARAQRA